MKRAENVVDCKIDHVWLENDSIIFQFAKSKGMQNGEDHVGPWHVYANPLRPEVCPFLAMARYLFTFPQVLSSNSSLFPGRSQYERFNDEFHSLLDKYSDDLSKFGVEKGDFGTHSTRKGVATAIAAGSTMAPPITSLCIRAGWTMGGVKDRYLKYEAAGDQFVGRAAACLDLLSKHFAVSPPHWDFSVSKDGIPHTAEEELRLQAELETFLKERLPNHDNIRPVTMHLVKILLASICYHYPYLLIHLSQECPLRASPLFRDIPVNLKNHVRLGYPWAKSDYTPTFTGLPPHTLLFADNEEVKAGITNLRHDLREDMRQIMLERDPAANLVSNEMLRVLNNMSEKLSQLEITSNSSLRLRSGDEQGPTSEFCDFMDEEVFVNDESMMEGISTESFAGQSLRLHARKQKERTVVKARKLKVGYFNNKLQILPPGWVIPKMTCFQLVVNWLITDIDNNIPALRVLKTHDINHLGKKSLSQLREMRAFMKVIERLARANSVWPEKMTNVAVNDMWRVVGPIFFQLYAKDKQMRNGEMRWKTFYNQMSKKKAFAAVTAGTTATASSTNVSTASVGQA
jgi:hypothetical protein